MTALLPPPPPYGERSLADVMPSVLAALGVAGTANPMGLEPLSAACVLLVDGLGWELLQRHAAEAPFLSAAAGSSEPIATGFPATTATSLTSLGTGATPGSHGIVGYSFAVPGYDRALNALRWSWYGGSEGGAGAEERDVREEIVPEVFQPRRTAFELAEAGGAEVAVVSAPGFARSGLTRVALRGGRYLGVYSLGDLAAAVGDWLAERSDRPRLAYAYHADLDLTAHIRGVGSEAVALQIAHVDRLVESIAARLPSGGRLLVTGDHGMVDVADDDKLDLADHPELLQGVRLVAGEPRARYVYASAGAEAEVLAAWRDVVGDRMWILSRDEAIRAGWFGPSVPDRHRPRIGDVVAAAREPMGVFQRRVEGTLVKLVGHHGSLTSAEALVPLVLLKE